MIVIYALEQNLRISRRQLAEALARGDTWDANILRGYIQRFERELADARAAQK